MTEATKLLLLANVALMLWTLLFACFMAYRRISSVKAGTAPGSYYVTYNKGAEPDALAVLSRHYSNLLESPLIFYAVSALALLAGQVDFLMAYLAIGYVAARFLHAVIHLTSNHVMARFGAFFMSMMLLLAMVLKLTLAVLAA